MQNDVTITQSFALMAATAFKQLADKAALDNPNGYTHREYMAAYERMMTAIADNNGRQTHD
jgi:hypothetical protein